MMRLALELYYDGRFFYGSQRQPGKRTVERELLKGLAKYGINVKNFQSASRTDRGVSALGNVYAFDTAREISPRALNSFLPLEMRALSIQEASADFHPRYNALGKVYKYFLYDDGYDLKKMVEAGKAFMGEHSFHNFIKTEEGKNPVRKVSSVKVEGRGDILILSFQGESFLWQMVRRMVSALKDVGKGGLSIEELRSYYDPALEKKFPPSPAEGLVLWRIEYPFEFNSEEYSRQVLLKTLLSKVKEAKTRAALEEAVIEALG